MKKALLMFILLFITGISLVSEAQEEINYTVTDGLVVGLNTGRCNNRPSFKESGKPCSWPDESPQIKNNSK
jgi:hypothetical protein